MGSSIRSPRASPPEATRAISRSSATIRTRCTRAAARSKPPAWGSTSNRATSPSAATSPRSTRRCGSRIAAPDESTRAPRSWDALDGMKLGRVKVMFRAGTEHRAALVLRGRGLSPKVTDTDPHVIGEEIRKAEALEPAAKATAKAVNAFTKQAHEILKDHPVNRARSARGEPPANAIVLRGAGVYPDLPPIPERLHVKAAGIAGVALIRGMFRACGIEVLDVKGATGGLDTDMVAKADAALAALESHDLVVLHVKAPDLCGHDGQASEKIHVIERLDAMMGHLKPTLPADVVVAMTADHSTPIAAKDHSGDPVPLTLFGEGVRVDAVVAFDERSAAQGALGRLRGQDVMNLLVDLAGRAEKFGA